jgi:ribosomal protein S12 methylthiotransferase accessory factor
MKHELSEALARFSALVDAKTGIIRSLEVLRIGEDDPVVFMAHAQPCDTLPISGMRAANRGAACSAVLERALVRACGESVERYCSALFEPRDLRLCCGRDLSRAEQRWVSVGDIYPYLDEQFDQPGFPFQRAGQDTALRWVQGQSLASGADVWLPASCVYVPYLFDKAVEPWTHMPISTGLAAGPSVEYCIEKGIFEIIERDALMIHWLTRRTATCIEAGSCRGRAADIDALLDAAAQTGANWHISLLTLDVEVPVLAAALIDPVRDGGASLADDEATPAAPNPPLTSFGIAANDDPVHALRLALEEAVLTRMLLNRSEELLERPGVVHERFDTLRDHLLAHASSCTLRERMRFLTDDGPRVPFERIEARFAKQSRSLVQRLADCDLEAHWVDVTTSDVRQCGLRVVRTIVPRAQPLDNDHRFRYLGGRRLTSVPRVLGQEPCALDALNPDPHPFP